MSVPFLSLFRRLLLVGGCEAAAAGRGKASSSGLSAWRVLSGSPYYKQVADGGDQVATVSIPYGFPLCSSSVGRSALSRIKRRKEFVLNEKNDPVLVEF